MALQQHLVHQGIGSKMSEKGLRQGSKPLMMKSQLLKKKLQLHTEHMAATTMCMVSLNS